MGASEILATKYAPDSGRAPSWEVYWVHTALR